jgi:hypothetical protein
MKTPAIALLVVAVALTGPLSPAGAADAAKLAKPINQKTINTEADEDEPYLSSNGQTLWFASNAQRKFDILSARRSNPLIDWSKPRVLQDVQTEVDDRGVCLTRDDIYPQYLFYATKKDKETNNFDIYVAVKQDRKKAFTEPTPVNAVDSDADEMHPWLTPDGKQLWFSRKTREGWRVFVTKRSDATGAQGFDKPVLVKDLPPGFCHATLTKDGKTMYLQGPRDKGRTGLFVTMKTDEGWSKPEALTMLNDPKATRGDRSPALSRDGFMLYFASDRAGGRGGLDIWAVPTMQLRIKK